MKSINIKNIFIVLVTVAVFFVCTPAVFADELTTGKCGEEVSYSYNSDSHTLTISGTGPMFEIVTAFRSNPDIEKVVIESGVETIGEDTFLGCSGIQEVIMPNTVKCIKESAFEGCRKLMHIEIPDSVKKIDHNAISYCDQLESIMLPPNVEITKWFLWKCPNLETIEISGGASGNLLVRDGVLYSHETMYFSDPVTYLTLVKYPARRQGEAFEIGSDVGIIETRAFEEAKSLRQISMPADPYRIALDAFAGCDKRLEIHYGGSMKSWSDLFFEGLGFDGQEYYEDTFTDWIMVKCAKKTNLKDCIKPKISNQTWTGKSIKVKKRPYLKHIIQEYDEAYLIPATVKTTYKNNKKVGTATVTYTGTGDFKGTVKATFKIVPKGTKILKKQGKKKAAKVTWKKQQKQTDGYTIQLATDKKFKHNKKTFTVKSNKKTSKLCKGLKSHKKYYVRVRTYKTVKGKKYNSKWSAVKTVTTK